jgi:trehalose 6-phosphate phosphatase
LVRRDAQGHVHAATETNGLISPFAASITEALGRERGIIIETKPGCVAVHYRLRPELEAICVETLDTLCDLSPRPRMIRGKMAVEVVASSAGKGAAVKAFTAEPAFSNRLPVFAGDDATDEDAFAVVNAKGGLSIKVGPGESCARYRAAHTRDFLDWLSRLANAAGEEQ